MTAVSAPPPWTPGQTIGRYTLLAKIATGGMAEIWLCRQAGPRGFEKVVVVKRIIDSFTSDPDFVEMFLDEARIAAQLNHPNIVQIFELGEEAGAWFIAMEYLPGENLSAVSRAAAISGRPVPLQLVGKLIALACEGLAHAHAKLGADGKPLAVVHRDISPQNVILTYEGQVKVVDFGIAKAATRVGHTTGGQVKGKFTYMAPEHARGEDIDSRADLFSLGVILFEMATRSRLYRGADDMKVLGRLVDPEPLERADARNPQVPAALAAVIARALAKDAAKRFQSAREFQIALEEWLATQGPPVGSMDFAALMTGLFAERIKARSTIIESATRGELTPSGAKRALQPTNEGSMPGISVVAPTPALNARPRPGRPIVIGAAVLAVLAVAGGVVALFAHAPPPVQPVLPPVVAVPAPLPPPPVAASQLLVDTEPAGAAISVDGKEIGRSPVTVRGVALGPHEVRATLEGREQVTRVVTVSEAGEHASTLLVLRELPPAPTPVPAHPAAHAVTSTSKAAKGFLTLDTTPWTRVASNGKVLGDTPLIELPLPPGKHLLKLVNEEKKINFTVEIEIVSGKTTTKKLSF